MVDSIENNFIKEGLVFRESDFNGEGKKIIFDIYNSLKKDIKNSNDIESEKKYALERLESFMIKYKEVEKTREYYDNTAGEESVEFKKRKLEGMN
jgi:hypothetical protein